MSQKQESSRLSLSELSDQHMARREAQFAEPISLDYKIKNEDGEIEDRVLRFRQFPDVPGTARAYHANMAYKQLILDVAHEEDSLAFLTSRHPKGHTGPTELELRSIWEIVGVEYGFVDNQGLNRLDADYQRLRESQVKQRKLLQQSTARKRRKKKSAKKGK